jgi:DNA repair and recombination protein RAD54B
MYQCIMGEKKYQGKGCLLADEMGLGKTLQSIALM